MSLQERVQHVMASDGLTVADIARAAGKSSSAVSQWLSGGVKSIMGSTAAALAQSTGYPASWWATGVGAPKKGETARLEPVDLDNHPDLTRIRAVNLRLQAGISGYAVDSEIADSPPIFFRADWMQARGFKPYRMLALKVKGQSMEPTLYEDDLVVANTGDAEPKDGEVFAINYEGEAVIKRLIRDSGGWWLSSDNPDQRRYPRKEWVDGNSVLIGRIVHRQSERI
jgi:phage repressor protein C with HTH and peptisase S24 domain